MSFAHLFSDAEAFLSVHGPVAVGVIVFLESFGLPLPGETILILSGAMAGRGEMHLVPLIAFAWSAAVAGDCVGYLIGMRLGRSLLIHHGARIGLTEARYARVERAFNRYGAIAVAFARFFDILRQLNGIVAGTAGMPFLRFLGFNMIGATLWVGVWSIGSYVFAGEAGSIADLLKHLGPLGITAVAGGLFIVVIAVGWFALRTAPDDSGGGRSGTGPAETR